MTIASYVKFVVNTRSSLLYRLTCKTLYYLDRFNARSRKAAVIPFLQQHYPELRVVFYDLGAAGGIDPIYQFLVQLPNFNTIGFDPDKKNLESLKNSEKIRYYPFAIAGRRGRRILYITKSPGCSSLFPPNEENLKEYPIADLLEVTGTMDLEVITLDEFVKENRVPFPDFLKVDVQGAEFEILAGSSESLENVIGLSFETRLREIYHGEGLFPATHRLLADAGFRLISKGGRSPHFSGETLEMDVAYVRGISSLDTEEKLIKAVLFCICHENLTFAAHLVRSSSIAAGKKTQLLKMLRKDFGFPETPETLMMKHGFAQSAPAQQGDQRGVL